MSKSQPPSESMPSQSIHLPIDRLREDFLRALGEGPVVVSSPTGSGKSTQVPRWCPGRVLVVEPRRVACRSLAQRVAELEGSPLGQDVGYHVRNERRANTETRLLFATPGVVLRLFDDLDQEKRGFGTVILDELHERGLETDLLLALLRQRFAGRLVAMSATLDGDRVAAHLGGRHLHAEGRTFPVEIRYLGGKTLLPEVRGLEQRLLEAIAACRRLPGDILVFLPGKGEIASCARALAERRELEILELHGGLSLSEQAKVFAPAERRKVILATNVAETSITVPGVGIVIDSGLVRQTRYHRDRGFLTLVPIARDSADQRAGRAGRTADGVALRLWSEAAQLEARTPAEIHREALLPLVLAAAACGARADALPFLDPPREHATATATAEALALGAIDDAAAITPRGRKLFGLPLDAPLGRLLVEAEEDPGDGILEAVIDLVSALALGRPLLITGRAKKEDDGPDEENPIFRCDALRLIQALRGHNIPGARPNPHALTEARHTRRRLREAYGLAGKETTSAPIDRKSLALLVLRTDPRAAYVARRRGRRVAWSHGGTEIELARESAAGRDGIEAIAVLETRALGLGGRDTRILATCAMPLQLKWLLEAGLGRDRVAGTSIRDGRLLARMERVHARKVLETREEMPRGDLARTAMIEAFLAGQIFPVALQRSRERLSAATLAWKLAGTLDSSWQKKLSALFGKGVPELGAWAAAQIETLGVESGEDLLLLSEDDLSAPELPLEIRQVLDKEFPRQITLPDAKLEVQADPIKREVILEQVAGHRREPPPAIFLPRFAGFRVRYRHKGRTLTIRG